MRRRLMREPDADEFDWLTDEAFEALPQAERQAYLAAQVDHRCRQFARLLIKWNFTELDDDENETPVPPTAEGVGRLDPETFAALWTAYNEATTVVPPPLSRPSDAGEPSAEELTLPQEPL